jgi:nitrite reductase/ring-hydroxylating ferredoxin subunit
MGTMKTFKIENEDILVANVKGEYYAISAICPHMSGYLGKGTLKESTIRCPVHGAEYDVKTGKLTKDIPWIMKKMTKKIDELKTYDVKIENGNIKVTI